MFLVMPARDFGMNAVHVPGVLYAPSPDLLHLEGVVLSDFQ